MKTLSWMTTLVCLLAFGFVSAPLAHADDYQTPDAVKSDTQKAGKNVKQSSEKAGKKAKKKAKKGGKKAAHTTGKAANDAGDKLNDIGK
jgi:Ni/Co efflux regulator RcnB